MSANIASTMLSVLLSKVMALLLVAASPVLCAAMRLMP